MHGHGLQRELRPVPSPHLLPLHSVCKVVFIPTNNTIPRTTTLGTPTLIPATSGNL